MALGCDEGADFGLEITGDLLPFIVFVLSQGFLVGSGVLVDEALEVTGSDSSFLSSFCSVSIVDPFSAILLLERRDIRFFKIHLSVRTIRKGKSHI